MKFTPRSTACRSARRDSASSAPTHCDCPMPQAPYPRTETSRPVRPSFRRSMAPVLHHSAMLTEQPFRLDLEYFEGRARGIATVNGVTVDEARRDLAERHGLASWEGLTEKLAALRSGREPLTPFIRAYRASEANDVEGVEALLDDHPELVQVRGT